MVRDCANGFCKGIIFEGSRPRKPQGNGFKPGVL